MELNVYHLQLFFLAAKFGGIKKAHDLMDRDLDYSAFFRQVHLLQDDLKVPLFETKPFMLTPAGQELFDDIKAFFEILPTLRDKLRSKYGSRLSIGAPELVLRDHLLDVAEVVKNQIPDLDLFMRDGDESTFEEMLRRREIDVAVTVLETESETGRRRREEAHFNSGSAEKVGRVAPRAPSDGQKGTERRARSDAPYQNNGFCALPLFELPLALVVPAKSKWKSAEQFLESLKVAGETKVKGKVLMLPPKHVMTRYFLEGLKQRGIGIDQKTISELETLDLIHASVRKGKGYDVGLSVALPQKEPLKGVRLLPLHDFRPVTFGILWQGELTRPMTAFIETVVASVRLA